ncbi:hypothetical protein OROHE_004317 [Orobanche hederae]
MLPLSREDGEKLSLAAELKKLTHFYFGIMGEKVTERVRRTNDVFRNFSIWLLSTKSSPVTDIPTTKDGLIDWSKLNQCLMLHLDHGRNLNYCFSFPKMTEPVLAFADLEDDTACATAYLQYVKYILENCKEYMDFFNSWIEKGIIDRLSVTWGCDLQSEHERFITEQAFGL